MMLLDIAGADARLHHGGRVDVQLERRAAGRPSKSRWKPGGMSTTKVYRGVVHQPVDVPWRDLLRGGEVGGRGSPPPRPPRGCRPTAVGQFVSLRSACSAPT